MDTKEYIHRYRQTFIRDKNISLQAKSLYLYLNTYADKEGKAYPALARILKETGCSVNTFYKYLKELKTHGYIKTSKQNTDQGRYERTIYQITTSQNLGNGKTPKNIDDSEGTQSKANKTDTLTTSQITTSQNSINGKLNTSIYHKERDIKKEEEETAAASFLLNFISEEYKKFALRSKLNHEADIKPIEELVKDYSEEKAKEIIHDSFIKLSQSGKASTSYLLGIIKNVIKSSANPKNTHRNEEYQPRRLDQAEIDRSKTIKFTELRKRYDRAAPTMADDEKEKFERLFQEKRFISIEAELDKFPDKEVLLLSKCVF
ncbi:MAG: helix-turn-helix domain-containing protein [Ignavibacteriales bacterium]|nr:helix-turn-helix domain-containing protein [Ignavibacteriales bacterium]MCF8316579.1 helix-turn-helix domain-containing protein [Ignavibacteriales bacterium]MCF8437502.1 helix-turn-helix domain-containing protein [Ignavibacteriales bacterium]